MVMLIAGVVAAMVPGEAFAGGRGNSNDVLAGVVIGAAALAVTGAILGAFATPEPPPPVVYSPPPVAYTPPPVVYSPPPVVYTPPPVIYAPAPPVVYTPPVVYRAPVVVHRPAPNWGYRHEDPRSHGGSWGHGR
jgi:hypothetical protein